MCVNKKFEAIFQGGEVFEDYQGGKEYGHNQVFNLFNRVRILNNACTPENHSNHVVPFDRLDLRANSTKRTSRGTRRTLPMRRPVPHGAGGVLHDRGMFLETLHINTHLPSPPHCVSLLVHDDSSEEALAACEGAVDNVALDGATRWGGKA